MNCTSAREIFPELLDSRTAPAPPPTEAHAAARAHLAGCPDYQREFSSLTQTLATLDRMTPPSTPCPRPLLRRVSARISTRCSRRRKTPQPACA